MSLSEEIGYEFELEENTSIGEQTDCETALVQGACIWGVSVKGFRDGDGGDDGYEPKFRRGWY